MPDSDHDDAEKYDERQNNRKDCGIIIQFVRINALNIYRGLAIGKFQLIWLGRPIILVLKRRGTDAAAIVHDAVFLIDCDQQHSFFQHPFVKFLLVGRLQIVFFNIILELSRIAICFMLLVINAVIIFVNKIAGCSVNND